MLPPGPERLEVVRVWYSITSSVYNNETLHLFNRGKARVIVATIAFGMGINRRDIRAVASIGLPDSLSNAIQEGGHAGRDLLSEAVGIIYVKPSVMK
ncbi:hypothetical protein BV22DRAFT_1018827 [Leucogyrophana mollusca]|uniref:Uncharacterized protein n=1 Tax=Leucogyrophana mollusca TaxID=85980 RepID=A0ACB8B7U2_9AGAM|nr:hypothetical protein BV22DRAFT_1018827 [Leucogyrophana mollusca]